MTYCRRYSAIMMLGLRLFSHIILYEKIQIVDSFTFQVRPGLEDDEENDDFHQGFYKNSLEPPQRPISYKK